MNHKKLEVWIKSMELVEEVYMLTNLFPKSEEFGLKSQMRRAAISIPSNISEGAGRSSIKENIRFLNIANGSIAELETQIIISEKLEFVASKELILDKLRVVRKLNNGLKKYLTKKII